MHLCAGNYRYYLEKNTARLQMERSQARAYEKSLVAKPVRTNSKTQKVAKLSFKEIQELGGMEARISALEEEIAQKEEALNDPKFYADMGTGVADFMKALEGKREQLTSVYARWEELEEKKAKAEAV